MRATWLAAAAGFVLSMMRPAAAFAAGTEFEIDPDLVNKLYQQTITEARVDTAYKRRSFAITPQVSVIAPSELVLSNENFTVPYSDADGATPALSFVVGTDLARWGEFEWMAQFRLGYGYQEGNYKLKANSQDASEFTAVLKLHRIPLSMGSSFSHPLPGLRFIRPRVTIAVGAEYLYQTGKPDGLDRGFLIPFYQVSPALSFFEIEGGDSWFGGVIVGTTFQNSFASVQVARGWSYDAGITLLF